MKTLITIVFVLICTFTYLFIQNNIYVPLNIISVEEKFKDREILLQVFTNQNNCEKKSKVYIIQEEDNYSFKCFGYDKYKNPIIYYSVKYYY